MLFTLSKRLAFRLFSFILGITFFIAIAGYHPVFAQKSTEILWDTYGVPHIYGKDTKGLFRAFGWAQMQSHGDLILRLYGQGRGRAAEYWGKEYLDSDRWVRTMKVPERAQEWYQAQNKNFRLNLDAFAEGINAYAKEHPELINDAVEAVLPVTGVDILAHGQRVLNFTFVVDPDTVAGITNADKSKGSNGWAIAPTHSASGKAMLLANPHLPWSDLYLWYEAQLTAPGIDAYGATLVGLPVLEIAFNDFLGWTHTVNTFDGWDAYELKLKNNGYLWDGKVKAFETEQQEIKIKQDDGTIKSELLEIKRSIHGAVVSQKDDKAIAIRVVGLDRSGGLEEWWDMSRAHNLTEFESALKRLQIPMFTVMYADREGHIMHLFNGQVPVRSKGDFKYWQGVVPGDTSATLWTKIHPYRDLPRILDPVSGWLQNTNDAPWTTTFPVAINPDNYPPYIAPRGQMSLRSQRSARMLMEDEKISFPELIEYKHSTRVELADRVLDDLITAARQSGNNLTKQAADVLAKWDRNTNADSRGAVLFATWRQLVDRKRLFAVPWSENAPLTTPKGIGDRANAVTALETAANNVRSTYGSLDVPWGQVFQLKNGKTNLPANGSNDALGVFRNVWYASEKKGKRQAIGGDSFVAAIEFSNPVKAMVLTTYGNSTQPNSTHINDQLELFEEKKLRSVWRKRAEIEAHLESQKVF
ncbi:Glutaryl-7-aminocephalosporanic-acid acylase [Crinalium epipsammum PCC 9333]|uniref:Glutaryl-7-aminocephalosporanic-acid acylase n=1 Tax=Crinalium epipsammum PCC 9333 TaxID=1173022 RepID=K9VUV4_9CYAN|nr:acylase [Crinalium epipsammum]AFZ11262.1 Glutaryl-7-aminocephalosporanic-acid acylase [Crinalium epipsammum PCC 9333]